MSAAPHAGDTSQAVRSSSGWLPAGQDAQRPMVPVAEPAAEPLRLQIWSGAQAAHSALPGADVLVPRGQDTQVLLRLSEPYTTMRVSSAVSLPLVKALSLEYSHVSVCRPFRRGTSSVRVLSVTDVRFSSGAEASST